MPPARIVLFALDELRARYAALVPAGADPRHDTAPFRAFRTALLDALTAAATGDATVSFWWEGGYNGYALAVAVEPGDAVPGLAEIAAPACPVDAERSGPLRRGACELARIAPGQAELLRDPAGTLAEAPFGAATGHFGAPGVLRRST